MMRKVINAEVIKTFKNTFITAPAFLRHPMILLFQSLFSLNPSRSPSNRKDSWWAMRLEILNVWSNINKWVVKQLKAIFNSQSVVHIHRGSPPSWQPYAVLSSGSTTSLLHVQCPAQWAAPPGFRLWEIQVRAGEKPSFLCHPPSLFLFWLLIINFPR